MSNCLACGEKLFSDAAIHPHCNRSVFATRSFPRLAVHPDDFPPQPLIQGKNPPLSVLQPEIPVRHERRERRLVRDARAGDFILKIPLRLIKNLTQNQNLCLTMAERLNIPTLPHVLIPLEDDFQGSFGLLLRRFSHKTPFKPHRKTLREILAARDQAVPSLEEAGEKIREIAHIPGLAVQYFMETVLFSFLIGFGGLDAGNLSVIYDDRKKNVRFAPLQEVACSKLLRPDEPDSAMSVNGKTQDLSGDDFRRLAASLGIFPKAYSRIVLRFFEGKRVITRAIRHSFLDLGEQLAFSDLVNDRYKRLMS